MRAAGEQCRARQQADAERDLSRHEQAAQTVGAAAFAGAAHLGAQRVVRIRAVDR